jgi:hypothetical protein
MEKKMRTETDKWAKNVTGNKQIMQFYTNEGK